MADVRSLAPRLAGIAASLLFAAALLHLARPMDVAFDSVCYLLQAQRFVDPATPTGWSQVAPCPFPIGYPAVLAVLLQSPLAASTASTLLNLTCIGAALMLLRQAGAFAMSMPASWTIWPALVSLNSFVIIRGMTPIASEPLFLMLQMLSLLLLARTAAYGGRRQATNAAMAAVAILGALVTRSVGVALLVAACWVGVGALRSGWERSQARRAIAAVLAVAVVIGISATITFGAYYIDVDLRTKYLGGGAITALLTTVRGHLREIGEIVLNIPSGKLPQQFSLPITLLGVVVAAGGILLLWIRRRRWTVFEPYLAVYAAIISVWPFYDARFWLPVIPIIALIVVDEIRTHEVTIRRPVRIAINAYALYFLLTGVAAHGVNLARSLDPEWQRRQYAHDLVGRSILAGQGQPVTEPVDPVIVRLLRSITP